MPSVTFLENENEISELLRKYKQNPNKNIKSKILESNLLKIEKIAKAYSKKHQQQFDDLFQVGCLGLINAIDKFDLAKNHNFKAYSTHFIVGEIKHYIRDYGSIVKAPRDLLELSPKINKAKINLKENDKEPSNENISKYLEIPIEKVNQASQIKKQVKALSLDQPLDNENESNGTFSSNLEDNKYNSFQLSQEDKLILQEAFKKIKSQSKQILEYAYYQDLTQTEISNKLGISQTQVSRRIKSALKEVWEILNVRVTPW